MSKEILNELKKDLKLAGETSNLTVSNISEIVKKATSQIVQELKFNKEMNQDIANEVMNITISTLKDLGEDTKENIKTSSEAVFKGVKETLEKELKDNTQKIEKVYQSLSENVKKDMSEAIDNVKEWSELSFDTLKHGIDGLINSAKEVLKDK